MVSSPVSEALSIADPVARNYAITRAYHQMSEQVALVVGHTDANWLTFGAWASATAGRFIRGEGAPTRWGASAVAEGNAAIIADIGPRFARFLELAGTQAPRQLRGAVADEPLLSASDELAEAFDCYATLAQDHAPRSHPDDGQRAVLMLRANLLVAHHEQRFADGFIDEAIPLGGIAGILATRFVSIGIPDGDLDVCRAVPRPAYLSGRQWPDVLETIHDARVRDLLVSYGQPVDDVGESAASSWEDFDERMGFIACFFRAYQRDPGLFVLPPNVPGDVTHPTD
jgi:hypothetical protein